MFGVSTWRGNQGQSGSRQGAHPLVRLRDELDSMFDQFFGGGLRPFDQDSGQFRLWDFDLSENDNEIVVRAELPGFDANELDVQINNDTLMISAEEKKEAGQERSYRSFRRSVRLPSGIDADKAMASFRNGVLEMHIPRTPQSRGKRITVQNQDTAGEQQVSTNRQNQATAENANKTK